MGEVLLVTGMSGAGRSTVSAALEDMGWFVIDNLPLELIVRVGELATTGSRDYEGVAFVVGRSGVVQPDALLAVQKELAHRHTNAKILFLDAPDDVLIHRFEGNRRRHPFEAPALAESIAGERASMRTIHDAADLVIDTGSINTNQLRSRIVETFTGSRGKGPLRVSLVSFGYSNGIPRDVETGERSPRLSFGRGLRAGNENGAGSHWAFRLGLFGRRWSHVDSIGRSRV